MRVTRNRAIAAAIAGAIALTSTVAVTPASARPYHHYRHGGPGGAVVLGAVAGLFGTIATLAARDRYERHYGYGYGYGPGYYRQAAPYGYYGGGPYYR